MYIHQQSCHPRHPELQGWTEAGQSPYLSTHNLQHRWKGLRVPCTLHLCGHCLLTDVALLAIVYTKCAQSTNTDLPQSLLRKLWMVQICTLHTLYICMYIAAYHFINTAIMLAHMTYMYMYGRIKSMYTCIYLAQGGGPNSSSHARLSQYTADPPMHDEWVMCEKYEWSIGLPCPCGRDGISFSDKILSIPPKPHFSGRVYIHSMELHCKHTNTGKPI